MGSKSTASASCRHVDISTTNTGNSLILNCVQKCRQNLSANGWPMPMHATLFQFSLYLLYFVNKTPFQNRGKSFFCAKAVSVGAYIRGDMCCRILPVFGKILPVSKEYVPCFVTVSLIESVICEHKQVRSAIIHSKYF